ncbi:MAG: LytTR family transcriptional regulator [Bacteroidales bacterium]|nr:LytTR family transcriptional regulator [Bacteroidales bacterium]
MQSPTSAEKPTYLYINMRDEMLRVSTDKIIFFEASGNYTDIVMHNGSRHTLAISLRQMQQLLVQNLGRAAMDFVRVGKSLMVNRRHIQYINVPSQMLLLSDSATFEFSLSASKEALRRLKNDVGVPAAEADYKP